MKPRDNHAIAKKGWETRRNKTRAFQPPSAVSNTYFGPEPIGAIANDSEALTVSGFWAAIRLFQNTLGAMPIMTYSRKTRKRLTDHPAYHILHDRPNPAMSRMVFIELMVKHLFLGTGNFYCVIQKSNSGKLIGLFPVEPTAVVQVYVDDDWHKAYEVQTNTGREIYLDYEMLHLFLYSCDGLQGTPLLRYAAENLGLHKQVQVAATSYYANAARPANYIRYPGKLTEDAKKNIKEGFVDNYSGPRATGKTPFIEMGGELLPYTSLTAQDAQIIEALGNVTDLARWFGLSPLLLADLSRGTYSNVAADNQAFYQKSIAPILEKTELELNYKLFGVNSDVYCEFLTESLLRGDPLQQAEAFQIGINSGYILRSEVRDRLNLPEVPGLDQPVGLLNLGDLNAHQNPKPESKAPDQGE